ncbi:MAG: formylglycine-generating enzyme family protein, partial [Gammaproteobacteria bacterium]
MVSYSPAVLTFTFAGTPAAGTMMSWFDGSEFVYVPAGDYLMGINLNKTEADNAPAHLVALDGFWIDQAEITNGQYARCVALDACAPPHQEGYAPHVFNDSLVQDEPVTGVDWEQARAYCEWIEGRLPTEAEWEKAARGTDGRLYPWGDTAPDCSWLNLSGCFQPPASAPVRSYPDGASPYRVLDMAGNVFEWTGDWYDANYYSVSPAQDPEGPSEGTMRVVRGSSFQSGPEAAPIILRQPLEPDLHRVDLGFRCVLEGDVLPPPPMCAVSALVPPGLEIKTPPDISITTSCIQIGSGEIGVINIDVGEISAGAFEVTTPDGQKVDCGALQEDATVLGCATVPD